MFKIMILFYMFCSILITQKKATKGILPESILNKIDNLFSAVNKKNSPGYAIGITVGDKLAFAKGYGTANLEYDIPIQETTVFSIASVSKRFTAACVALLIIDGKLSLEADASQYIPGLKKYIHKIKIKHLLYNTSGLKDYHRISRKTGKSWITLNYFDIDEAIDASLSQKSLLFKPGTEWNYSNVNFMLLAKIIEKVSNLQFRTFIKKRIFEPLKMAGSYLNDDITMIVKNRAIPYNIRNSENIRTYLNNGITIRDKGEYIQHPRVSPHYGGSGIMSSIEDLAKWSIDFHEKKCFPGKFYKLMHKVENFKHNRTGQAFGLVLSSYKGRKTASWDGGDWGISSQLSRFPDKGVSIIVLSNLGSGESFRKVREITDILINEGKL